MGEPPRCCREIWFPVQWFLTAFDSRSIGGGVAGGLGTGRGLWRRAARPARIRAESYDDPDREPISDSGPAAVVLVLAWWHAFCKDDSEKKKSDIITICSVLHVMEHMRKF